MQRRPRLLKSVHHIVRVDVAVPIKVKEGEKVGQVRGGAGGGERQKELAEGGEGKQGRLRHLSR